MIKIDELTEKKISKVMDGWFHDMKSHPNHKTREFAGALYMGMLKTLNILDIKVKKYNE